jgi:hypothetical protein
MLFGVMVPDVLLLAMHYRLGGHWIESLLDARRLDRPAFTFVLSQYSSVYSSIPGGCRIILFATKPNRPHV